MKLLSLFSGVGGLDSAVERAFSATCVAHCEADAHCRKVLARHWPGVPCFDDVRKLTAADVGPVDVVCGGFPCTDLSVAGKQEGMGGAKSGLWSEYLRLVRELRPSIVVIENVPPLYRKPEWRGQVEFPLAELGYRVLWTLCKASDAGAPHRRERTFALAILPGVRVPMLLAARVAVGDASWPTPTRQYDMANAGPNGNPGEYLLGAVQEWTTPTARDRNGAAGGTAMQGADSLGSQAQWPTPITHDAKDTGAPFESKRNTLALLAATEAPGRLNPNWTEPLVGLPIGWTEAEGPAQQIDWAPKWPAGRGQPQHSWEPPRTVPPRTGKDRRRRLMAIGNIVVPQQAALALALLAATANDPTQSPFGRAQMVLL